MNLVGSKQRRQYGLSEKLPSDQRYDRTPPVLMITSTASTEVTLW